MPQYKWCEVKFRTSLSYLSSVNSFFFPSASVNTLQFNYGGTSSLKTQTPKDFHFYGCLNFHLFAEVLLVVLGNSFSEMYKWFLEELFLHAFWFLKKTPEHRQLGSKCSPLFFDLNSSTCLCLSPQAICMLELFKSRTGPRMPRYPIPRPGCWEAFLHQLVARQIMKSSIERWSSSNFHFSFLIPPWGIRIKGECFKEKLFNSSGLSGNNTL